MDSRISKDMRERLETYVTTGVGGELKEGMMTKCELFCEVLIRGEVNGDNYSEMFSCRSFFELKVHFESLRCIPRRYLKPISRSNSDTETMSRYLLGTPPQSRDSRLRRKQGIRT